MISKEEVLNLAELARLKLSDAEVESLQKDISNILDYVGQVSAVGVSDVEQLKPILRNVMREDKPYGAGSVMMLGSREALLEALPKKEKAPMGGFFNVVRKIIQKDE
ncbi:MAG: Asp-tRNA(Asn)/Glu-tRNA(Gln) amidotransferase subunit GatC [Patescibacteria group bacterium]|nr:Asp-tRNA(Asn)/Glu-tRNA(Gln) amidotransferase subunit GatC [Patescibacteria group bacterium]